jgi:hypothetical protein
MHDCQLRQTDDALFRFRAVVEEYRSNKAGLEELRGPLQRFYATTRRDAMPPEQVLLRIKHALDALGMVEHDLRPVSERSPLRERIITFAITTYYADAS